MLKLSSTWEQYKTSIHTHAGRNEDSQHKLPHLGFSFNVAPLLNIFSASQVKSHTPLPFHRPRPFTRQPSNIVAVRIRLRSKTAPLTHRKGELLCCARSKLLTTDFPATSDFVKTVLSILLVRNFHYDLNILHGHNKGRIEYIIKC